MTPLPRLSEESEESFESAPSNSGKNTNFSRPRRGSLQSQRSHQSHRSQQSFGSQPSSSYRSISDRGGRGSVHAISAFHEPNRDVRNVQDFPDEPRFSSDSDDDTTTSQFDPSTSSSNSSTAWDGRKSEPPPTRRPQPAPRIPSAKYDQQRFNPSAQPRFTSSRPSPSRQTSHQPSLEPLNQTQTRTTITAGPSLSGIVKRVSVDQQSERISISTDGAREDDASHHTVSSGDSGSFDMEGNWQSSNYETTGLSDAEIRKLLRKGINPSLYAEMKAAKKGKSKWVGPLLGNSFIG